MAQLNEEHVTLNPAPSFADYLNSDDPVNAIYQASADVFYADNCAKYVDKLSPAAKAIFFISELVGQVGNGGFVQYFNNSYSDYLDEALYYLAEIGAHEAAMLLRTALLELPFDLGATKAVRMGQFYGLDEDEYAELIERLDSLDLKFYDYLPTLQVRMLSFVNDSQSSPIEIC